MRSNIIAKEYDPGVLANLSQKDIASKLSDPNDTVMDPGFQTGACKETEPFL